MIQPDFSKSRIRPVQLCVCCGRNRVRSGFKLCRSCGLKKNRRLNFYG